MFDNIRQLIGADKLETAIEELLPYLTGKHEDLTNDLIKYQADLARNKRDSRRGLITSEEQNKNRTRVCYAILEMLKEVEQTIIADPLFQPYGSGVGPSPVLNSSQPEKNPLVEPYGLGPVSLGAPTVFISYNHADSEVADKLKAALERNGIAVRIDKAVMEAGANIQEFIESSIRDTSVTLSIVSNRSLLSAWVALESIDSFYHERFTSNKKFIACYLDDDFFRIDFRLKATKQIDLQIEEIDRLIPDYITQRIDTNDLNSQKSRLYKLRNNLGDILLRLKESLCLDIREENFGQSVAKIVSAIKN